MLKPQNVPHGRQNDYIVIYTWLNLSLSHGKVELRCQRKGTISYGLRADFSLPHSQGIGKQRGTISSWHKRTAGRNLVVHRHGTTLRQSVQRYRCRLYFSLFFSHFDIKACKSPEDIVGKEAFHSCPLSCPCQIVDGYCVLLIAFKPILYI